MPSVVIVDDSPTELENLRGIMEQQGFSVHTANNASEGIALTQSVKPNVVLMDVVMPDTNGFNATRKLKKGADTKDIPVVMVTTKNQPTDRDWAISNGATGFVNKPVNPEELINTVRQVMA